MFLLGVLGVLIAGVLSSCQPDVAHPGSAATGPKTQRPLTLTDVPTIRIRLNSHPLSTQALATSGGYRLWAGGKKISESRSPISQLVVRRSGGLWQLNSLSASGNDVVLEPLSGFVGFGQTWYRGSIRLLPVGTDDFFAINHVDLESYLAGVLSKELYPNWSSETYRALAVAARTFALYHMKTSGPGHDFDVGDDQASQVYGGRSGETDRAWEAVRKTHGLILCFGPSGGEQIFMAQYSASCGGNVNPAYVIRDAPDIQPVQGGQKCDDCRRCSHYRWPTVRISKAEIARALAQAYPAAVDPGGVSTIRVLSQTPSGRAVWIDVTGPSGKATRLRAEDLRLALLRYGPPEAKALYSMNCRINNVGSAIEFADGKGFGHGVGICQWGAQGKAERGMGWEEILQFYYPGAKRMHAY
ncbi:MAG: SpoIID/LytB domain-containing protein [Phycisphaerae bacterium]